MQESVYNVNVPQRDTEVQDVLGEGGKTMHARVSVHIMQRDSEIQDVLGEGGKTMHARVSVQCKCTSVYIYCRGTIKYNLIGRRM